MSNGNQGGAVAKGAVAGGVGGVLIVAATATEFTLKGAAVGGVIGAVVGLAIGLWIVS